MTPPGPIQRLALVVALASAALPAAGQDRLTVVDVRPAASSPSPAVGAG